VSATSGNGGRPRSGIGRKLLLQLALLPLLLIGVELAYRAWAGASRGPAAAEREMRLIAEAVEAPLIAFNAGRQDGEHTDLTARRIPSPYWGWEYENRFPTLANLVSYFSSRSGKATYDILIFGGSVAGGFYYEGSERLVQRLREDPRFAEREFEVIGCGKGGAKQPQQLNYLVCLLGLGWKPDLVINLDGFNEVAIGNQNAAKGAHPIHPSVRHWGHLLAFGRAGPDLLESMSRLRAAKRRPGLLAESFLATGLRHSAVLSALALERVKAARNRYVEASGDYDDALCALGREDRLFGPPPPAGLDATLGLVVQAWMEASRDMQAICDELGVEYVHALQPTLHDVGSKPLTPQEIRTGKASPAWVEGAGRGYPMLRAAGARLREEGVNFVDTSLAFEHVEDPLYFDACHFTQQGQELLADRIAAVFLAQLPGD